MKKSLAMSALLAAALLGGCESMSGDRGATAGGMQVTRTHLGQAIARSEIRVEPFEPPMPNDPGYVPVATVRIQNELARLGWTVVPSKATTEQVAIARVTQNRPTEDRLILEVWVQIERRSDTTVFWEGRAQGEVRMASSMADRTALVDRLAAALFRDFPGESGRTIRAR